MSYLQNKNVIRWLGIASFIYAIICLHGCAQLQTKESTLSPPHKKYTVTMPANGWEPIKLDKGDLALWHKQHHATIAFISTNVDDKEVSLEMLNSQLFIGIKGKEILLNESTTVDNQNAIHTMLAGEMDNCKLKIDSYVIRAGNYIHDLVYWAPSDSFDYVKGDFENIVRSFKFTQ